MVDRIDLPGLVHTARPAIRRRRVACPATTAGFLKTIARIGKAPRLPFPIHPHMLRHSTGYKLANDGHDTRALQHYMGHKNIMHTVRYTDMAPDRFKNFWKD